MSKTIEKNVAEILVLIVFLVVVMSSCSVSNNCAAYASAHGQENDYEREAQRDKELKVMGN
tara:strand:- start:216 stop:398 length:183 start_codon:yes stop_codon:yes gene_type:complete